MVKIKALFFPALIVLALITSCQDDLQDKYQRPEWLAGKIYTQMLELPEISTFVKCVELTGYDKILDVSGSYTVFAPSNEAFNAFFAASNKYNSIEDIPLNELNRIVKYHIVQNPWSKQQLRSLDVFGWIDTLDIRNNQPGGFKRETLLLERNQKFGVNWLRGIGPVIVDTTQTGWYRRVVTDSRKYVPLFYPEYLNIYEYTGNDYEFYFNRPFEGGNNIYFGNGKIVSDEVFSENGFIYVVDAVVSPLKNAYEIMTDPENSVDYDQFFTLVNEFARFAYNREKTFEQPGADLGYEVDSLFDLDFPELTFDLSNELTSPPADAYGMPANVTFRYHHGILVPNDQAFESFVNEYIKIPGGWGTLEGAPRHIRRIIANSHMSEYPLYATDLQRGFTNGEIDVVELDQSTIIQKQFGSNATFLGLNKAIVPRAFSSVTGPIYLRQGYTKVMMAIEATKLLPTLKRKGQNYLLFVESDSNTSQDSSLLYSTIDGRFSTISTSGDGTFVEYRLNNRDLRTLLLTHVAIEKPKGQARKEYMLNMAGSYLIFNNETGEVSGTAPTTDGYMGMEIIPNFPTALAETDNGTTYDIKNWFSFSSSNLFTQISTNFPEFHALLQKAGLSKDKEAKYTFISESEVYTVFAPSAEAIAESGLDALPIDELVKVLQFHFIQGRILFTDGNKPGGYLETARIDEKSTPFSTIYTQVNVETGVDVIRFRGKNGSVFTEINESESTNYLAGIIYESTDDRDDVFPYIVNNAVIHRVDKVLDVQELNTK